MNQIGLQLKQLRTTTEDAFSYILGWDDTKKSWLRMSWASLMSLISGEVGGGGGPTYYHLTPDQAQAFDDTPTYVAPDWLSIPITSGATYHFKMYIHATEAGGGLDLLLDFTGSLRAVVTSRNAVAPATILVDYWDGSRKTFLDAGSASGLNDIVIEGIMVPTGSEFSVQFTQSTSDSGVTRLKAGSFLSLQQISA